MHLNPSRFQQADSLEHSSYIQVKKCLSLQKALTILYFLLQYMLDFSRGLKTHLICD